MILRVFLSPWYLIFRLSIYSEVKHFHTNPSRFLLSRSPGFRGFLLRLLPLMLVKINQAATPLGPSVRVFKTDTLSHRKRRWKKRGKPSWCLQVPDWRGWSWWPGCVSCPRWCPRCCWRCWPSSSVSSSLWSSVGQAQLWRDQQRETEAMPRT